jgi:hypothetical protein
MVTVPDLLESLHRAGGTVRLDGGDLLLRFPATPPADLVEALRRHKPLIVAFLRGETVYYDHAAGEGDLPGDDRVPADGMAPADGGGQVAALLDKLHAHGCFIEALGDGRTFRGACPSCGMPAALDIVKGPDGVPHVWARCNCLDPLAGLDNLDLVPLVEFRGPQPARSDADLPEFPSRKLGAKQQTFAW